jgi:hypothetical protein
MEEQGSMVKEFVQSDVRKGSDERRQARRMAWGSIRRDLEAEEVELDAAWLIYVKQRLIENRAAGNGVDQPTRGP